MNDYEKWKERFNIINEGQGRYQNENKFIIEQDNQIFQYTYFKEEREVLIKKARKINLNIKSLIFENYSEFENDEIKRDLYKTDIIFIDEKKSNREIRIELSCEVEKEDNLATFHLTIDNYNHNSNNVFIENKNKLSEFANFFMDYISSFKEFRLLIVVGNLELCMDHTLKTLLDD